MKKVFLYHCFCLFVIDLLLCKELYSSQKLGQKSQPLTIENPPVIIYKTKRDYSRNIPVLLSDDKKEIVSYPHPMDIMGMASKDVMPIRLHDGYYLDRRGINKNVAFLRITYASYRKLRKPLSIKEIEKNIIDRNPLEEIYSCPSLTEKENIVSILNSAIDSKTLSNLCK
jgi:hypothetical protein